MEPNEGPYNFNTEVQVRLPETDAMGIVFHGNYFVYFDVGRVDYLSNLGLCQGNRPIKEFDNVVVAANCDFKSPARLHDLLVIEVRIGSIRKSSFTFDFRLRHRQENRLIAMGSTVHCAIGEGFQPISVPEGFRKVIAEFEGREF